MADEIPLQSPNDCYNRSVRAPFLGIVDTLGGRGGPTRPGWSMPTVGIGARFCDCDLLCWIASCFARLGTVMKFRSLFSLAITATMLATASSSAVAQDAIVSPSDIDAKAIDRIELFDSLETSSTAPTRYPKQQKPSLAELKQSRAIERANARAARVEYNAWVGRDPLRPSWNATPMTHTRYAPRVVYVPVYVYGR